MLGFLVAMLPEPELWSLLTSDALSSFLFVALGIWITWGRISRTAESDVASAESVRESATAYGGQASAVPGGEA